MKLKTVATPKAANEEIQTNEETVVIVDDDGADDSVSDVVIIDDGLGQVKPAWKRTLSQPEGFVANIEPVDFGTWFMRGMLRIFLNGGRLLISI